MNYGTGCLPTAERSLIKMTNFIAVRTCKVGIALTQMDMKSEFIRRKGQRKLMLN
jgi:hypothetical protein